MEKRRDIPQPPGASTESTAPERPELAKAARLREALTAEAEELFHLIQAPDPDLLKNIIKNPHLCEDHLLALLKRRDLPEQVIKAIQKAGLTSTSRRLKLALAGHPNTPASVLSTLLPQLFLFELVTLMQIPGSPSDLKLAAERSILRRLPETELGSKLTLARRGSPAILEALLKEGERRLVDAVLANPRLKEAGVHAFLTSAAATAWTISAVARHPRWGSRPNLRFAMLRNRKTPVIWFTLFLPSVNDADLEALLTSKALTAEQLQIVGEEREKRGGRQHSN